MRCAHRTFRISLKEAGHICQDTPAPMRSAISLSKKEKRLSTAILASIRQNQQLRGSVLLAAQELAHRADSRSGEVMISYSYLAGKCHQSKRTAIRHIHRLLDLGIIRVQRFWRAGKRWGINKYIFIIKWEKPAQNFNSDTLAQILPKPRHIRKEEKESEKFGSLINEQKAKEKVLSWLTEGSALWELTQKL
jgi:hypothetical protein